MTTLSGGTVSLPVHPDTKGFGSKMSAGVMGQSSSFTGLGKKLGGLIIGGLVVAGIGAAISKTIHTGFDEAKDASAGIAQLNAGLKSTGNVANVSVKGMSNLAASIQAYSGQTDDSIVASEKLLLTFTNIRNVGPDKIFNDATKAAADMAAKMGGDAASKSVLLGKALNDPVKGITALTRVGVAFTQAQKDQIAAMVKSGDTIGAQKIILKELGTEFGGAAKAAGDSLPGQLERIHRGFEDVTQTIVEAFLPVVTPALKWVADQAGTAGDRVGGVAKKISTFLQGIDFSFLKNIDFGKIKDLAMNFSPLLTVLKSIGPLLPDLVAKLQPVVQAIGSALGSALTSILPALATLASTVGGALATVLVQVAPLIADLATQLGPVLGDAIVQLAPSIGDLVVALLPLLPPLVQLLVAVVPPLAQLLTNVLVPAFTQIIQSMSGAVSAATSLFDFLNGTTSIQDFVKQILAIKGPFGDWQRLMHDVELNVAKAIANIVLKFEGAVGAVQSAVNGIISFVTGIPGAVQKALSTAGTWLVETGKNMIQGLLNGAGSLLGTVGSFFLSKLPSFIREPFKKALGIHSPSKVFMEFGKNTVQGYIDGLTGSESKIKSTVDRMTATIKKSFDTKAISKGAEKAALNVLDEFDNKLEASARQRDRLADKMKLATDKLVDAINVRDNFAAGVKQSVLDLGNITGDTVSGSAIDMVANLQEQIGKTQQFTELLAGLKAQGLDDNSYKQLVDAGVAGGGLAAAQSLAAGGAAAVATVARLQAQLAEAGKSLGATTSTTLYQSGVDSAQGLLDGLKAKDAEIVLHMENLAKQMVKALKRALKIKSPSQVFSAEVGEMIPAGVVAGIDLGTPALNDTVAGMIGDLPKPAAAMALITAKGSIATLAAGSTSSVSTPAGATLTQNIYGVTDPQVVADMAAQKVTTGLRVMTA